MWKLDMTAKCINGKQIAAEIQEEIKTEVIAFQDQYKVQPCLAVVLVGDDPPSKIYVNKKIKACNAVGIKSLLITSVKNHSDLLQSLKVLGLTASVHGILVQLPLPKEEWTKELLLEVFAAIPVAKDVDVFNPYNVGLLVQGLGPPPFLPCTPHGIQIMLARSGISVKGKKVCIINRSNVIGKPLSSLLIQDNDEYANATVTVCHDNTPPDTLKWISQHSDIVVVAVGIPGFLKADMVQPGSVVIDVGISRVNGKIVGDVDPGVWNVAGWVSRTPGGVGPMTVTMLLKNTLQAARMQNV